MLILLVQKGPPPISSFMSTCIHTYLHFFHLSMETQTSLSSDILQDLLGNLEKVYTLYCNPSSEFWVRHRKPPKQMSDPPQLIDAKEHQPWILFFRSDLHFMTKDEGWNVDRPDNRDFFLSNQLFLHHNRQKQHPHYCEQGPEPSIHLQEHPTVTQQTVQILNSST